MNRETLENTLAEIKEKHEKHYLDLNKMTKNKFLGKKIKFKTTETINNETENKLHYGLVKDVTVTSDCDLMLEVKNINTKETKIIFSHNVLGME